MTWRVIQADCVEAMSQMEPASIDAVVTDPPYGIRFMGKAWDVPDIAAMTRKNAETKKPRTDGRTVPRDSASMYAGAYDFSVTGNQAFQMWCGLWATEALRVLKPGAHLLAFGGTRTFHRLTCALEDAGFEIRDCLSWLYGSGFPKSLNLNGDHAGWGTALKPAWEPIILARKPLTGNVASNVQAFGTGALNIDGTRIDADPGRPRGLRADGTRGQTRTTGLADRPWMHEELRVEPDGPAGRWPANVVLDPEAAALLDEQTGETGGGAFKPGAARVRNNGLGLGTTDTRDGAANAPDQYGDTGGASRFFYCPKADREERDRGLEHRRTQPVAAMQGNLIDGGRLGGDGSPIATPEGRNPHPTVKPVALMSWLCRLITPPGGTVLDPFTGSGSTGIAALREGFNFVGIEREADYVEIARDRILGDSPLFNVQSEVPA